MEKSKGVLYPALVVSGISVTAFSLLGIVTMTGWIPTASSHESSPIMQSMVAVVTPFELKSQDVKPDRSRQFCHDCGVVESIRISELAVKPSGPDAVASGAHGAVVEHSIGGGNAHTTLTLAGATSGADTGSGIEQKTSAQLRYVVHVGMDDGGYRTFYLDRQPAYHTGERIRLAHGSPIALNSGTQ